MRFAHLLLAAALAVPAVARADVKLPQGQAQINEASSLIVKGDFARAEPLLRQAIQIAPRDPYGHYNLAVVLKNTGRYDEALQQYRVARDLFEHTTTHANGENDVASALYGVALTEELKGDPRAAVTAWNDYLHFASKYHREQPAVAIARQHLDGEMRAANMPGPYPFGPQTATRPHQTR